MRSGLAWPSGDGRPTARLTSLAGCLDKRFMPACGDRSHMYEARVWLGALCLVGVVGLDLGCASSGPSWQQTRQWREERAADERLAMEIVHHEEDPNLTGVLVFLPGTKHLILACGDHGLLDIDVAANRTVRRDIGLPEAAACMAVAATADTLVLGTRGGHLYRWKVNTAEAVSIADTDGWPIDAVAISPDGERIAWVTNGKHGDGEKWVTPAESLVVVRAADGQRLFGTAAGRGDYQPASFAPDGRSLTAVRHGEIAVLDAATGDIRGALADARYRAGPLSVACGPQENAVAVGYAPYDIALWDLAKESMRTLLKGHTNWVVALAFTADGTRLVSGAGDSTARVWDVRTGQEIGRLRVPGPSTYIRTVAVASGDEYAAVGVSGAWWLCRLPANPADR
jgi:WD40 repeat protein